jgi:tellurite resistance protein
MGATGGPPPLAARPAATVRMEFASSVADVRAVFFDVDLAVRAKIHRGVRLHWLPRMPNGERRLRQETHVLDRVQHDEVSIEEGEGGTWVKRFVDGPSVGSSFVAAFEPAGHEAARVELAAFLGPRGFAQGLGKLSPLGLEKSMTRLLGEYRRALEGYDPGVARDRVLAVVAQWSVAKAAMKALEPARRREVAGTLIETAWSMAALDDEVDDAEKEAMRAVVATLWDTSYSEAMEERMTQAALGVIGKQGAQTRCEALGAKLKASGMVEQGIAIAVLVAEVSHGLDPAELMALKHLAAAAGMGESDLLALVERTDEQLFGATDASAVSRFL